MSSIAVASTFMALLGVALASLLSVANRRLYVYEDPRIEQVMSMLPNSNCGACGMAGCRNFAEKVIAAELKPAHCTVNAPDKAQGIASFLGVEVGEVEKRVARLACAGAKHVAYFRARYAGHKTCRAAALVGGGGKGCAWGCLGLGDCEAACELDAIYLDKHSLPHVIADHCTACGDCVEVCPKDLFSLQPLSRKLWVNCKNLADGETAERDCEVACTACGRCAAAAPGLIRLQDNLAFIDYARNEFAAFEAIERCPTGAIVWLEDGRNPTKGQAAKKIVRQTALPVMRG
jgi:Na+-translocating ferredoxin:NAD+ oxidoreductase RNF subunit RnfB